MSACLYLIPNALGHLENPEDLSQIIPQTVLQMNSQLRFYVAENAKTTRAYLKQLHQLQPLPCAMQEIQIQELNVNTPEAHVQQLLQPLLDGHDLGLISEAGLPAVADPGAQLVKLAHQHGIPVRPLVGPCSLVLGLMASGLNGQSFAFNGYLPTDPAQRSKRIKELEERSRKDKQTQIFIETPYRNAAMLEALALNCQPTTQICVATDLTLSTEEITSKSAKNWKSDLQAQKMPAFHKKPSVFLFLAN